MSALLTGEAVQATQERAARLGHPAVPVSALATFLRYHATVGREALVFALGQTLALLEDRDVPFEEWPEAVVTALVGAAPSKQEQAS